MSAQVYAFPAVIEVNVTPLGILTVTGVVRSQVVPSPSVPTELPPQQYAAPALVSAQVCPPLAVIEVNVTPAGMLTAIGPRPMPTVVVPFPSSPRWLIPQQ